MWTNDTTYLDIMTSQIQIITNPISGIAGDGLYSECTDKHKIPKEDETPANDFGSPMIFFCQLSPAKLE